MKAPPFDFIIDTLSDAGFEFRLKPMFGCVALYQDHVILLVLRKSDKTPKDNGVWVCTSKDHHESLKKTFKDLRFISIFGKESSWLILPEDSYNFEEQVLLLCERIVRKDPRIGKEGKIKLKNPRKN